MGCISKVPQIAGYRRCIRSGLYVESRLRDPGAEQQLPAAVTFAPARATEEAQSIEGVAAHPIDCCSSPPKIDPQLHRDPARPSPCQQ